jgi:sugar phosphate isomerase/epimerase
MDRRGMLTTLGMTVGTLSITQGEASIHQPQSAQGRAFRYCLNTSTIRGQKLGIEKEIDVAGKAGYDAIEPWFDGLHAHVESGGSLKDLKRRIEDHGMTVESAIGFAPWIVNDDAKRKAGLEQAKKEMDMLAQIGGIRMAAPPAGAPGDDPIELQAAAERYRRLLEIGESIGVIPQIEMWGGHPIIGRISTAVSIAIESGHPKACFLGDVYHTYKGGCPFDGLKLLGPLAMRVFHFNDYPADPPRETINDSHRVYPGDGIAPLNTILQDFVEVGACPVLSLEVFNRSYWAQDAALVASTGLAKMKAAVRKSLC